MGLHHILGSPLSLGVENAPVKLVPRTPPFGLHISLCRWPADYVFYAFLWLASGLVPLAFGQHLYPFLLAQSAFSSWLSLWPLPSSLEALSLTLSFFPFPETLFSQSSNSAIPGQGTHLVIGIFSEHRRGTFLFPCIRAQLRQYA